MANEAKRRNVRRQFRKIALFQKPDFHPRFEGMAFWDQTVARWHREGLPPGKTPWEFFGLDRFMDNAPVEISYHTDRVVSPAFWPPIPVEILEETDEYVVRREDDGIVKKQLRKSVSMPAFLGFPVESRRDWDRIKKLLDPHDGDRYADAGKIAPTLRERTSVLRLGLCGGYGFQRSLLGEERLAYSYYDEPDLIHDMMGHWLNLYAGIADNLCPIIDFDYVFLWEDMAYKTSSLISPQHFRTFIYPYYRELISHLRSKHALDLFMVDSDGNNFPLLPLLLEAGVNMFTPLEVAAGMEPVLLRQRFPELALLGGLDKRALLGGKKEIYSEVMRTVPAVVETGGFFPSIDHHVPSDISFDNFCYFVELIRDLLRDHE